MKTNCAVCGKRIESGDAIDVAGLGRRCYPCFNRETAGLLGVDLDDPDFQPIVVEAPDGYPHTFSIRSLQPAGHEIEAVEILDEGMSGGYRFAVLGDIESDAWVLFQRLYETMRREMAIRHVERTEFGWQVTSDHRVVGRIEWDPNRDERIPLIVIDGKAFTWEQFGHMLMTFEGFTLEARIRDTIELVERDELVSR